MMTNNALILEEDDIEASIRESLHRRLRKIYQSMNTDAFVMDIDADTILEEVYTQSQRVEEEKLDDTDYHDIYRGFQKKFKWYHAASISMMFLYAVLSVRKCLSIETLCLIRKIEQQYRHRPQMREIQKQMPLFVQRRLEAPKNPTINIYMRNNFSGEIKDMHLAHADVAVGVAEAGANVYHHKTNDNGRQAESRIG